MDIHLIGVGTQKIFPPFASTFIRNDQAGRLFVKEFARDTLGVSEEEVVVSKDKRFSIIIDGKREIVPSFRGIVSVLPGVVRDIFGGTQTTNWKNVSVEEFLEARFGSRCAKKIGRIITACTTGSPDPKSVSAMAVIPRLVEVCARHRRGVLLGPLAGVFSEDTNPKKKSHSDILDSLWQKCVSGGAYLGFTDWSVVEQALVLGATTDPRTSVHHSDGMELMVSGPSGGVEVTWSTGSKKFDLVITSLDAESLLKRGGDENLDWAKGLSASNNVSTSVVELKNLGDAKLVKKGFSKSPGISWSEGPILGAVVPRVMFQNHPKDEILVFHETGKVTAESIIEYISLAFPGVPVRREDIALEKCTESVPACALDYAASLTAFNQWRQKLFGSKLQVLGKSYYAPSGSPSDILTDVSSLVDRIDEHGVCHESRSDWVNRAGKSLDGAFVDYRVPVVRTRMYLLRHGRRFAMDQLPSSSPSWFLMEKCVDFAADRGADAATYSPWLLTDLMQNTFSILHEVLPPELGWLGAVAVSALTVRALVFPLTLQSIREGRLKSVLLPQYSELIRGMAEAKVPSGANSRRTAEKLNTIQRNYMEFTAKYGNVALKGTLASAIQIPMIMTGIVACNGVAMHPEQFPAVALESPLWLVSASLPDPYYILPAINGLLVWSNMRVFGAVDGTASPKPRGELFGDSAAPAVAASRSTAFEEEQAKRIKDLITSRMGRENAERTSAQIDAMYKSKMMKMGKKMFPLLVVGITAKFPAITLVYTISNISGAMVQNALVGSAWFQKTFAIPAQARRSGAEVQAAMERADEIRKRITELGNERRMQKGAKELEARKKFKRGSG